MRYTDRIERIMFDSRSRSQAFFWVALGLTLSPVLLELARHLLGTRFDHYIIVPALLFTILVCAPDDRRPIDATGQHRLDSGPAGDRSPEASDRRGILLLGAALCLLVLGYSSSAATLARLGAALAIIGMGRFLGSFSWRTSSLLLLAVPIPAFVSNWMTPWVEAAYLDALNGLLSALGAETESSGQVLQIAGQRLELFPEDTGLRLACVGAAFGLFEGLRGANQPSPRGARSWLLLLRSAAIGALVACAMQFPGVVVAGFLVWVGGEKVGNIWLGSGLWIAISLAAAAWILRRERKRQLRR